MRSRNSMCRINPKSPSCTHWQHRVCRRCANWTLRQDQRQATGSVNGQPKLITVEQCQRLRRELQSSLFNSQPGTNPMTILMLLFFMGFAIFLILWLLAKAFLVKSSPGTEPVGVCPDDRQSGGHASVENIMQQLRASSAKLFNESPNRGKALYVPPQFWDKVSMNRLSDKCESVERANHLETDRSDESDGDESRGNRSIEDSDDSDGKSSDEESTTCSSLDGKSMGSIFDENESSITMDIDREAHRYYDAIGRLHVTYGLTTMTSTNCRAEGIRWANWLTRNKNL